MCELVVGFIVGSFITLLCLSAHANDMVWWKFIIGFIAGVSFWVVLVCVLHFDFSYHEGDERPGKQFREWIF